MAKRQTIGHMISSHEPIGSGELKKDLSIHTVNTVHVKVLNHKMIFPHFLTKKKKKKKKKILLWEFIINT